MRCFLVIALLGLGVSAWGQHEALFDSANQAYEAGRYLDAVTFYDSLIQLGDQNGATYFNLGNAYYQTKQIPKAILAYERALKYRPGDEDIEFNLKLANLQTADKIQPSSRSLLGEWWINFLQTFTRNQWAWLAIGALWLMFLFGLGVLFLQNSSVRRALSWSGFVALLVGIVLLVFAWQRHRIEQPAHPAAILMEPNVYVKSAPGSSGTDLFILHGGAKVLILEAKTDWLRITIDEDKQGWVPAGSLEKI